MPMKPKISVVVPTYNQAAYLPVCLDSLYFQDYPNLEIIVISDPSPDNTSAVLHDYRQAIARDTVSFASHYNEMTDEVERRVQPRYPQQGRELIVVENPERLGHSASYNKGFQFCTGEYCTYVASDDICHPKMISTLAAPLEKNEADFIYSDMFIVDDTGRILREFRLPDYNFPAGFCDWYLLGVSKLYRRALHERFGWYSEDHLANDHECYLRFALEGARFRHVPETLYSVRSHEGREFDVHTPERFKRLFEESKKLVLKARQNCNTNSHR